MPIKTERYGLFNRKKIYTVFVSKEKAVGFKHWDNAKIYEKLLEIQKEDAIN